jgi:hypothetical protein
MNKMEQWRGGALQRFQVAGRACNRSAAAREPSNHAPQRGGSAWFVVGAAFAVWLHSPAPVPAIHFTVTAVISTQPASAAPARPARVAQPEAAKQDLPCRACAEAGRLCPTMPLGHSFTPCCSPFE